MTGALTFETYEVEPPEVWAAKYPLFRRGGDWRCVVTAWTPDGSLGSEVVEGWGDTEAAALADARRQAHA